MSAGRSKTAVLVAPAVLLVAAAFIIPVSMIIVRSFTDPSLGFQNYEWLIGSESAQAIIIRTLRTALIATLVTAVIAYPYAYLMATTTPLVRGILMVVVLLPFWTSMMVRAFAWVIILQRNGLLNTFLESVGVAPITAVIIGMCQILMPFMVLPMVSVMLGIDRRLPLAGQVMGASRLKAFVTIYFPRSMPGVFAGSLIVFILSLGFYVTPALLGSPREQILPNALYSQVLELLQWGRGGALAVALLLLVGAVFLLISLIAKVLGVKVGKIGGAGL